MSQYDDDDSWPVKIAAMAKASGAGILVAVAAFTTLMFISKCAFGDDSGYHYNYRHHHFYDSLRPYSADELYWLGRAMQYRFQGLDVKPERKGFCEHGLKPIEERNELSGEFSVADARNSLCKEGPKDGD